MGELLRVSWESKKIQQNENEKLEIWKREYEKKFNVIIMVIHIFSC